MSQHPVPVGPRPLDVLDAHIGAVADAFGHVDLELDAARRTISRRVIDDIGGAALTASVAELVDRLERALEEIQTAARLAATATRRHCGTSGPTSPSVPVQEQRGAP